MKGFIKRFYSRWQREYLIDLRESHKMKVKTKQIKINIGDVVCIFEEGIKRRNRKKGKIARVINSKSDVVG